MANINDDIAHVENEQLIDSVTRQIRREYNQASKEMKKKLDNYLAKFNEADEKMKERVDAGEVTYKEYEDWRRRQMLIGSRWEQMLDTLTKDAVNADKIAMSIVKGHMPEAYAIGHNYGTYLIESGIGIDTSYTLYDRFSVERLWREKPKLLPDPDPESETARRIKENKDYAWNKTHIQSAVTQSITQGESLRETAKRLQTVTDMDYHAAQRNAGTMLTSAHNGGRLDSFKRAEDMGIKCKKTWLATLDGHTRKSHIHIDGETIPNNEEFSNGCMFPGDPDGDPREVYNCRCVLITQIEGFERDVADPSMRYTAGLQGMSYDDWKAAKGDEPLFKAARNYTADSKQYEEYTKLLGKKNVPANMRDFQNLKYTDTNGWEDLKARAREARKEAKKK